jgi:hypothetical protein
VRTERIIRPRTRAALIAAISTILVIAGATGATATGRPDDVAIAQRVLSSSNPEQAYAHLTPMQQKAFGDAMTPVAYEYTQKDVQPVPRTADSPSGCWGRFAKWTAVSSVGVRLYSFWQTTNVCWTDLGYARFITDVWITDIGQEILSYGWRVESNPTSATLNASWEGRGRVQWFFALGSGGWDIQHTTPCGRHRLNANGYDFISDNVCSLS